MGWYATHREGFWSEQAEAIAWHRRRSRPGGKKDALVAVPPLPPGRLSTVRGDDRRFVEDDWFILGRFDDVINVAGHRLGTREIEEAVSGHPDVAVGGRPRRGD